jgi:transcriptional regulator with XRE-family HTH domain
MSNLLKYNNMKAFAQNLRKARAAYGMTQEQVAAAIGVKTGAYQKYEEGRCEPNIDTLVLIGQVLEITNLPAFLSDPEFNWSNQGEITKPEVTILRMEPKRGPYNLRSAFVGS